MHENSTSTGRRGGIALALCCLAATGGVWAACTIGADPDPRASGSAASARPPAVDRVHDDAPQLVAVAFAEPMAPVPLGESAVRQHKPPPSRTLVVAVGQNVAHVVDRDLAAAFLGEGHERRSSFQQLVDRDVVDALMMARADFGVIGGRLSPREQHAGLRQTQLGIELFALAVAPDSPLQSLTSVQVRQIFTGQATEWKQLGLPGGTIVPVVPADPGIAERAARSLIAGDDFVSTATRVASLRHVADQTLRNPGAVGVVRVTDQPIEGVKLLQIDWTAPSFEAFSWGTYPYAIPFQLITSGAATGEAEQFAEFAKSDEGRELLGRNLRTR